MTNISDKLNELALRNKKGSISPKDLADIMKDVYQSNVHIECDVEKQILKIPGGYELVKQGYYPLVFRYSRKANNTTTFGERKSGPTRIGWHLYEGPYRIRINRKDEVEWRIVSGSDDYVEDLEEEIYDLEVRHAFKFRNPVFFENHSIWRMVLPFGRYTKEMRANSINKNVHFNARFAIAFAKPETPWHPAHAFETKYLASNMTFFKIHVMLNNYGETSFIYRR